MNDAGTQMQTRMQRFDPAALLILLLLVVAAQLSYGHFLSPRNILNLLTQNANLGIVALGMTLVIIGGGFDLSVSGTFSLGAVLFAGLCVFSGFPVYLSLLAVLAVGALLGLANGVIVTVLNVNPFIATLGTSVAFEGLATLYSRSAPIPVRGLDGFMFLGSGKILGLAVPVILLLVLLAAIGIVLARSTYGRTLYAVGGSLNAARLAGLRTGLIRTIAFVVCGATAALSGAMIASTLSTGQTNQIPSIALDAIAAVVIGGNSLYGGEGAIWRTAVGVLILAVMNNLFSSLAVDSSVQNIIKGVVVIGAVALESYTRHHGANWAARSRG